MLKITGDGRERVRLTKEEYDSLKRDKSQRDIIVRAINKVAFGHWNLPDELTLRLDGKGYLMPGGGLMREDYNNAVKIDFNGVKITDEPYELSYSLIYCQKGTPCSSDELRESLCARLENLKLERRYDVPVLRCEWKVVELKQGDNRSTTAAINREGFNYLNLSPELRIRLSDQERLMLGVGLQPEKDIGVQICDNSITSRDPLDGGEGKVRYYFEYIKGDFGPISNADLKARLRRIGEKMGVKEHKVLDQIQSIEPGVASKGKE